MDEEQKRLDIFKIVTDLSEKESDRGMARYRMMFFLQSVLAAIASLKPLEGNLYVLLLISIIGILFCLAWYWMMQWNFYWQDRWIGDQKAIIDEDETLKKLVQGRTEERLKRPNIISGRVVFQIPIVSFGVVWSIILVYCVYSNFFKCV